MQMDRLKRAAKRKPLLLSAVSGEGVQEALQALLAIIDESKVAEAPKVIEEWRP